MIITAINAETKNSMTGMQQEEVNQIDVEGAPPNVLHRSAQTCLLREQCLLVAEEGEQYDQACQCQQPLEGDGLDGQYVGKGVYAEVNRYAQRQ